MTMQVREPCTKCFRRDSTIYVADLCAIALAEWPDSPRVCKSCSYELGGSLAYLRFYGVGSNRQLGLFDPDVQARAERAHAKLMADAATLSTTGETPPTPPSASEVLDEAPPGMVLDMETGELSDAPDGVPSDVTPREVAQTKRAAKSRS